MAFCGNLLVPVTPDPAYNNVVEVPCSTNMFADELLKMLIASPGVKILFGIETLAEVITRFPVSEDCKVYSAAFVIVGNSLSDPLLSKKPLEDMILFDELITPETVTFPLKTISLLDGKLIAP